jgi:diguanylate cyclase (GGDEF)-like protein
LLAPKRILVVDDDEQVRDRLALMLEEAGYEVRTACDGAEALDILLERFYPLLLTDAMMPRLNGQDLCRAVRLLPLPGYIYTVILSVHDSPVDVVTGLSDGADDYISKKASRPELLARLNAGRRIAGLEQRLTQRLHETQELASIDDDTGAYNTRHVNDQLQRELERSVRYGHNVAVMLCELEGDPEPGMTDMRQGELPEFVARLTSLLRDRSDWVARWRRDQVLVVLPETAIDEAYKVANRISANLRDSPIQVAEGHAFSEVSIGIVGASAAKLKSGATVERLMKMAEQCLLETRQRGHYRIVTRDYGPGRVGMRLVKAPGDGRG